MLQFTGLYYLAIVKYQIAGVRNVEVRPAISTDLNPNRIPNPKLSLLEMAENNIG